VFSIILANYIKALPMKFEELDQNIWLV